MMNDTLYVSDLDGTLLNPDAELEAQTAEKLNQLIEAGVPFSVATARTWATVEHLLQDVHLQYPVVLMNGVCLYDPAAGKYLEIHPISRDSVQHLINTMHENGVDGFLYQIRDEKLYTYYEQLSTQGMRDFVQEREERYHKVFTQVADLSQLEGETVYLSLLNTKEKLNPIFEAVKADSGLHVEYYPDIYAGGFWYLEMSAGGTSKAYAVRSLKEKLAFQKLVTFGDNRNDLPMFSVSDEAYAVQNAVPEVLTAATGVIGPNTADGVPEYLKRRWNDGQI